MVISEATAKFVNRNTEKINVSPMAGSARTLPAIKPFKTSCSTCIGNSALIERTCRRRPSSYDFQKFQLALLDLGVAKPAGRDVADLIEVAGTGNALVVDVLSGGEQLEPFDGRIDLL